MELIAFIVEAALNLMMDGATLWAAAGDEERRQQALHMADIVIFAALWDERLSAAERDALAPAIRAAASRARLPIPPAELVERWAVDFMREDRESREAAVDRRIMLLSAREREATFVAVTRVLTAD